MEMVTCPACGKRNDLGDARCIHCAAVLIPKSIGGQEGPDALPPAPVRSDTTDAPTVEPGSPRPDIEGTAAVRPASTGTGMGKRLAAGIAILVIAAGFVAFRVGRDGGGFPDRVANVPRATSSNAKQVEAALAGFHAMGVSIDAAIYGDGPTPEYMLVVVKGLPASISEADADTFFQDFGAGFASSAAGGSLDLSRATRASRDGADYLCAPSAPPAQAVLCLFKGKAVGMLFDFTTNTQVSLSKAESVYGELG